MSDPELCPGCGAYWDPGARSCWACGFTEVPAPAVPGPEAATPANTGRLAGQADSRPGGEPAVTLAGIAAGYTPVDWAAAWKEQPEEVDWLIEPVLEAGTVNVMFAKSGTGKSLLALEWALRLVRRGRTVVYVDDENRVADIVERLQAFGAEPGELGGLLLYSFAGLPALDTVLGGMHLTAVAASAGASLVVLDTTTRMVAGRENDSDTFLQLYRCSLVPLKARGITVLRLDHPGKNEALGQRGSNAKDGDADAIWKLTEVARGLTYRLHRDKNRSGHGPGDDDITVTRKYGPLRHDWSCPADNRDEIRRFAKLLDDLRVPPSSGRDRCRTALNESGAAISNDLLSKVVRHRRLAPDSVRDSPDSPARSAKAADCPSPRVSKTHGDGQAGSHPSPDGPAGEAVP